MCCSGSFVTQEKGEGTAKGKGLVRYRKKTSKVKAKSSLNMY